MELKSSIEQQNLYRALAELAYVIALADDVVENNERAAFYTSVEKEIGREARDIVKSRFEILDDYTSPQIAHAYNNVIYTIQQNKTALDEIMIEKFMNVMNQVAEVSGICTEEQAYIDKFRQDVLAIYFKNL